MSRLEMSICSSVSLRVINIFRAYICEIWDIPHPRCWLEKVACSPMSLGHGVYTDLHMNEEVVNGPGTRMGEREQRTRKNPPTRPVRMSTGPSTDLSSSTAVALFLYCKRTSIGR